MRGKRAKLIFKLLACETMRDHMDQVERLRPSARPQAVRKLYRWLKREYKRLPGPVSERWTKFLAKFQTLETGAT